MSPPKWHELDSETINKFTMNKTIYVHQWYIDEAPPKESQGSNQEWTEEYVDSFIKRFTPENIKSGKHGSEYYNNASFLHVQVLEKYAITGKKIAVIGSLNPWIEAICLNFGNSVTTVEYNVPKSSNLIRTMSFDEFASDSFNETFDVIISYSSIEHSGLGRYGDPIDPDGDIKTMSSIYKRLEKNGLLFLGIPVGRDGIAWNAHRIYGHKRLPIIYGPLKELEWIGLSKNYLNTCTPQNNGPQPIIVLQK
jgi:hypothetical protein